VRPVSALYSCRQTLNGLFFREEDAVKRGTKEYDEFWTFLAKYEEFQRKKAARPPAPLRVDCPPTAGGKQFDIPREYDRLLLLTETFWLFFQSVPTFCTSRKHSELVHFLNYRIHTHCT